jgi:hypothetical protein
MAAATGEVPMAEEAGMEAASAAQMEAAAAMAGGEAVMATAASVMAAWSSTDLVFSGMAYFSTHFRLIIYVNEA